MTPVQTRPLCLPAVGEPRLQELLDDPILHLLMQRDGVSMADLTDLMAHARKRLIAKKWQCAA